MSSHFNYEIDERNLRLKLRDMAIPYREDAWLQFENYSNLHHVAQKLSSLPSFQLNINRTLILPFVFGGVIILFSLLLFNFISIKNKPVAVNTTDITNKIVQKAGPPEKIKTVIIQPAKIEEAAIKIDSTELKVKIEPIVTPTVAVEAAKVKTETTTPAIVPTPPVPVSEQAGNWTAIQTGKIYSAPNIASPVIGSANSHQTFKAIAETVYFIKIWLNNTDSGYIRKDVLQKYGTQKPVVNNSAFKTKTRKKRRVETLESIQTPINLSGEEKEPDLK